MPTTTQSRSRSLIAASTLGIALVAAAGHVSGKAATGGGSAADEAGPVFEPGHPSLREWLLPEVSYPEDNAPTAARVALGKMLFFDPRLGGDGNMSCASCHNPLLGWSDGLPTARGHRGLALERATPTIVNTAYNSIQMWDGREKTLEGQAIGPMAADVEMNTNLDAMVAWLRSEPTYRDAFASAYPGAEIGLDTVSKALASFERTVVSDDSPFDRWVRGDDTAMTAQQIRGFRLFVDPDKGNCAICHEAPNFTDDGFHNVGLASFAEPEADQGRYAQKPLNLMRGAFKTPTLRDVALTAPYFHDGSARTLADVIDHYVKGGEVRTNLSPNMKALDLTAVERADLVAFLHALTTPPKAFELPTLPVSDQPTPVLVESDDVEEHLSSR